MSVKITALPALAAVADTDYIPVVDMSGPTTKKMLVSVLRTKLTGGLGTASQMLAMNFAATGPEWRSYITNAVTLADTPATGLVRVGEAGVIPVIQGLSAGVDYNFCTYNAAGAQWVYGNTSQYSFVYGYAIQLLGGQGVNFYDGRSGVSTDATVVSVRLAAPDATTASNVIANIPSLTVPVQAGETWEIELFCNLTCSGVGGVKFGLDCPAGCTVEGYVFGCGASNIAFNSAAVLAQGTLYGVLSNVAGGVRKMGTLKATVIVGGVGGNITMAWASVTNLQTSTMFAGAHFKARRCS